MQVETLIQVGTKCRHVEEPGFHWVGDVPWGVEPRIPQSSHRSCFLVGGPARTGRLVLDSNRCTKIADWSGWDGGWGMGEWLSAK
jgi:hypothetical protein